MLNRFTKQVRHAGRSATWSWVLAMLASATAATAAVPSVVTGMTDPT